MEYVRYADILNGVDHSWSKIEKAKYIYKEICKMSSYDERFIYSQNPELLRCIYNRKVNVDEYINPRFICKTLNDIYSELLRRVGIQSRIIGKKSKINKNVDIEDKALIFYDEEDKPYFTAIAGDTQRCKYGLKTKYFGIYDGNYEDCKKENVISIKSEKMEEIDKVIGYLGKSGIYSDTLFEMLSEEVKQNNEFKKHLAENGIYLARDFFIKEGVHGVENLTDEEIKQKIKLLDKNEIIKIKMYVASLATNKEEKYGPIENKRHSATLLDSILNKSEWKVFDVFDMVKEHDDTVEVLSFIRFDLKPEPIYYRWNEQDNTYQLVEVEEAIKLAKGYRDSKSGNLLGEDKQSVRV